MVDQGGENIMFEINKKEAPIGTSSRERVSLAHASSTSSHRQLHQGHPLRKWGGGVGLVGWLVAMTSSRARDTLMFGGNVFGR